MSTYLLRAKRDFSANVIREKDNGKINKITKGYTIQVPSGRSVHPAAEEIEKVLLALGIGPSLAHDIRSDGNWDITKL